MISIIFGLVGFAALAVSLGGFVSYKFTNNVKAKSFAKIAAEAGAVSIAFSVAFIAFVVA